MSCACGCDFQDHEFPLNEEMDLGDGKKIPKFLAKALSPSEERFCGACKKCANCDEFRWVPMPGAVPWKR